MKTYATIAHRPASSMTAANRQGTTLTEVLMGVMLMGIGVVTLASLFPISIMQSVKATQLTNATQLRYNAESMLEVVPAILDSVPTPASVTSPPTVAVIDPLGFYEIEPTYQATFGNDGTNPAGSTQRTHGGFSAAAFGGDATAARNAALRLVTLPDSWVTMVDETPQSFTATEMTFPSNVNLDDVTVGGPLPSRIMMFDSNDGSLTRNLSAVNGNTCSWNKPLPTGFDALKARVQTGEMRYTWMLTVRKRRVDNTKETSSVNVVVFFRRRFSDQDELIYSGAAGNPAFQVGSRTVTVNYGAEEPFLKKGGFVFDSQNGFWYRILNYTASGGTATVTVDRPVTTNGNAAIFMRGIVDVFPIGNKES